MKTNTVAGVILAAGKSSRFGGIKQILPWRDKNLLNTVIETALLAGLDPVIVVLGANAGIIRETITENRVRVVINHAWEDGQSTSLKAAVGAIPPTSEGVLFLLSDQPQLSVNFISSVAEEGLRTGKVVVPIINDRRANPVYFPKLCFPLFDRLEGDAGGRQIVSACPHTTLPWLDDGIGKDIDTNEDYQLLREYYGL